MLWMIKFVWLQFFPWMLSFQIEKWFFCGLQTFFLFPACRLTVYICVCRYIVSVCLSVFFPFVSLLIINYVARMHSSSLFKYSVGSSWISKDLVCDSIASRFMQNRCIFNCLTDIFPGTIYLKACYL